MPKNLAIFHGNFLQRPAKSWADCLIRKYCYAIFALSTSQPVHLIFLLMGCFGSFDWESESAGINYIWYFMLKLFWDFTSRINVFLGLLLLGWSPGKIESGFTFFAQMTCQWSWALPLHLCLPMCTLFYETNLASISWPPSVRRLAAIMLCNVVCVLQIIA